MNAFITPGVCLFECDLIFLWHVIDSSKFWIKNTNPGEMNCDLSILKLNPIPMCTVQWVKLCVLNAIFIDKIKLHITSKQYTSIVCAIKLHNLNKLHINYNYKQSIKKFFFSLKSTWTLCKIQSSIRSGMKNQPTKTNSRLHRLL